MFKVGELIIYSGQGICRIDDICEKTYLGITQSYYVLHPIRNYNLKISVPVDNDKVMMLELISKEEAEEIIESFKEPGIRWIEVSSYRIPEYSQIIKKGNRKEISKIANTLIRKKHEAERKGKKFYEKDNNHLNTIQSILFVELAISLNTTFDEINEKITNLVAVSGA